MPSAAGTYPPVMEAEEIHTLASLLQVHDPRLGVLELKTQLRQDHPKRGERPAPVKSNETLGRRI